MRIYIYTKPLMFLLYIFVIIALYKVFSTLVTIEKRTLLCSAISQVPRYLLVNYFNIGLHCIVRMQGLLVNAELTFSELR